MSKECDLEYMQPVYGEAKRAILTKVQSLNYIPKYPLFTKQGKIDEINGLLIPPIDADMQNSRMFVDLFGLYTANVSQHPISSGKYERITCIDEGTITRTPLEDYQRLKYRAAHALDKELLRQRSENNGRQLPDGYWAQITKLTRKMTP